MHNFGKTNFVCKNIRTKPDTNKFSDDATHKLNLKRMLMARTISSHASSIQQSNRFFLNERIINTLIIIRGVKL